MGTISMSFTINLTLTFLMGVGEEERLIWDLLFQALDQFIKERLRLLRDFLICKNSESILLLQDRGWFMSYFPQMKHCRNETGISAFWQKSASAVECF